MISSPKTLPVSFGFLRLGLFALAIVSMLIPATAWVIVNFTGELPEHSLFALSARLIAPVMAPMLIVLILLDIIMSRVKAADAPDQTGDIYRLISRIEVLLIIVMLIFWIPYFIFLIS